ncbi:hypothetical protein ACOSQ3_021679 [Xanthoceras sorbifolium]
MFVNCILKHKKKKKKSLAYQIVYRALKKIQQEMKKKIHYSFYVKQYMECVGGSTYQVPIEIESAQGKALVVRCIELVDVAKGSGNAIPKMVETHRMTKTSISFYTFSLIHEQSLYRQIDL